MRKKDMTTIHPQAKRLYEAAEKLVGLTLKKYVADRLNISFQLLNKWEERGVPDSWLWGVEETFGCAVEWLRSGVGPMVKPLSAHHDPDGLVSPADVSELVLLFGQASPEGRAAIMAFARSSASVTSRGKRAANNE